MRQYSDDEEGFIPSDIQIRNKYTLKLAAITQTPSINHHYRVNYRYSTSFIKKQHPLALVTPLTLPQDPLTAPPNNNKNKFKLPVEHPYKYYCSGNNFSLLYSRHSDQPLIYEREYLKNDVPLLNLDDHNSPSLKELKSFQLDSRPFNGDDLAFDSKFESGNLNCAFRRKDTHQYHLFIDNDTNTTGYNQWFYFAIRNTQKSIKYKFNLVNYRKRLQFFQQGQRIALFSLKEAEQGKNGWRRAGNRFSIEESNVRPFPQRSQFILSFQLQFHHDNDYVLLASSLPYSYSKLIRELKELQVQAGKSKNTQFTIGSAGQTVCNNQVPEVTITAKQSQKKDKQKRMIIIMARQHPGEVWSSYVAEGMMRSLLKDTPEAKYLLQNYIIKIFPMMNIDGVIYGNFRCDVTGVDLNRRWRQPSHIFHPHIFDIKKKLIGYNKKWRINACFDLHGHSKKYNIFCYACKQNSYTCRILPLLIQNQTSLFNMPSCTFGLSRNKQTTARATISKIIRSQNVLTIETSSFGWRTNETGTHFHPIDLYKVTASIVTALSYFLDKKCKKYQQAEKNIRQNFTRYQEYDHQNKEQSGSDSQPEEDQIDFKQKIATVFDKKFQQEYKSFTKDDAPAQLHCSQIVFNQSETLDKNSQNDSKWKDKLTFSKQFTQTHGEVMILQKTKEEQQSTKIMIKKARKSNSIHPEQQKKSMSINHSDIGFDMNGTRLNNSSVDRKSKGIPKSIMIKQKKRYSFLSNQLPNGDIRTLNPRQVIQIARQEVGLKNIFQQVKKQEDKRIIQNFVSKFQRFIPANLGRKNKCRLDLLEQGLQNDDTSYQLNLMFQNKRKLELQRIKRSIQDSTQIAERQGKIRIPTKKDPIIDFKRFKQNQKTKQQIRKLGQLSERYLQGHY